MQIHIDTKVWCHIQINRGFLPTLEEINVIIDNFNKIRDRIIITDVEKHNNKIIDKLRECNGFKNNSTKKIKRKIIWYIYLIKVWKFYKIWKTININNRFNKYVTENPEKPELIHTFKSDDYTKSELELHDKFKNKNYNREWFKLDKNDVLYIKTLKYEK